MNGNIEICDVCEEMRLSGEFSEQEIEDYHYSRITQTDFTKRQRLELEDIYFFLDGE